MIATRIAATGVMLALLGTGFMAQDKPVEKKFTLRSYGDKGQLALEAFAAELGYSAELPSEADDTGGDIEQPCWFSFKDQSAEQAASILSTALGLHVAIHPARKKVSARAWGGTTGRSTRGFDVSVLASRYVEYVNRYGAPKAATRDGKPEPDRTATEHLQEVIEDVLGQRLGDAGASCVGNRILMNLTQAQQRDVGELLSLLMSDKGGSSASMVAERELRAALAKAPHQDEYNERPLGSVMASLFAKSGGFVVAYSLHTEFTERHVTREKRDNETVADFLNDLANQYEFAWGGSLGVVRLTSRDGATGGGYRVFELKDLLERLASAYAAQKTQPGKTGGFEGDIKTQGGMAVVVEALNAQAASANNSFLLTRYGTRLVVSGSAQDIDAAAAILKEMGFEEPKEE